MTSALIQSQLNAKYLADNATARNKAQNAILLLQSALQDLAAIETSVTTGDYSQVWLIVKAHAEQHLALNPADTELAIAYSQATEADYSALIAALQNVTGFNAAIVQITALSELFITMNTQVYQASVANGDNPPMMIFDKLSLDLPEE